MRSRQPRILDEKERAAQLCAELNYGGFNDWFLPSRGELDLMHRNLYQEGIGGFSAVPYWSSSEYYDNKVWFQIFGTHARNPFGAPGGGSGNVTGFQNYGNKEVYRGMLTRAIRSF